MRNSITRSFLVLLLMGYLPISLLAQATISRDGTPFTAAAGITMTVDEIIKIGASKVRLQGLKSRDELSTKTTRKPGHSTNALPGNIFPKGGSTMDIGQNNTQGFHSNFSALDAFENGVGITPPDCMGDIGLTQVCIASNNGIKWYAKPTVCDAPLTTSNTSGIGLLPNPAVNVYIEDFFASVSANESVTDPHVHYDRLSQRWFIVAINTAAASNRVLIAVSSGPTISGTSSFTFYQFAHDVDAGGSDPDKGEFCDYPTLGVDKNALYIGGLIFGSVTGSFKGTSVYVVRKSSVTGAGPLVFTAFRQVGTTNTGMFCAQGVHNDDPAADRGYFVAVSASNFGQLDYFVVNNPGGTPSITPPGIIDVPDTDFPNDVTVKGSTKKLDAADDRLLNAHLVKNKLNGSLSIWTSHNIGVNSSGLSSGAVLDRSAVRWYQLNVNGNTLSLNQSGTMFDNGSTRRSYWMGSVAGTGQGHAAVGATMAGPDDFANVAIAGRYGSTPSGTLFAPVMATNFEAIFNLQADETVQRWGDYSQTVVDPGDDMTLWTFQQFTSGTDRWAVRATQLKAPPPAAVSSMTAITCTANRTVDITLTGSVGNNFAGYFDPGADAGGPGFSRRLAVSSTGSVTISDLVFVSPTQLNFKLNYAAASLGTNQTLTITNPDCQSVTFQYTLPSGCQPLPVAWLGINARWINSQGEITWKVGNERNVKLYEIERSNDGNNYSTIGRVNPATSQGDNTYTFVDPQPGQENLYRIRQIDIDGKVAYSSVVALNKNAITKMSVLPNPSSGPVRLLLPSEKGTLRLMDLKGQSLLAVTTNSNTYILDTQVFARGVYIVEFTGANGKVETEKLILR
jgi:hypothetical protein